MSNYSNFLDKILFGKKHVIWDWNGTLLNDVHHAVSTMNYLLESHALPKMDVERYKTIFEFPVLNYYQALGFDFSKESFEDLCHKFVDRFMSGFRDCPLIPGMREILIRSKSLVKKQSILSATDQQSLDEMVEHFALKDQFDYVYGINNKFASSKLERGQELIAISNVPKHETILIGDTIHDLEVGESLGIEVILLSHGHQCAKKLRSKHKAVLELEAFA